MLSYLVLDNIDDRKMHFIACDPPQKLHQIGIKVTSQSFRLKRKIVPSLFNTVADTLCL